MQLIPVCGVCCLRGKKERKEAAWLPPSLSAGFLPFSLPSFRASPRTTSPPPSSPPYGPRASSLLAHTRFNLLLLSPAAAFLPHRFVPLFLAKALALVRRFRGFLDPVPRCCAGERGAAWGEARLPPQHSWAASIFAGVRFDWRGVFLETYTGAPIRRRVPARSGSPTLMRLSHCESNCADPLCYIPCLPKSKDASPGGADALSSAAPCPVGAAVTEDKPPPVQKIEAVESEKDDEEGGKDGDGEKTLAAALPPPKSNLKKPNCADGGACAPKGNVKWLDLLGKDLTEVKEFEPSESGDSMDDGDGMSGCICVIQ